ncbi:Osteoclast-stimulating factor 1 [Portunus trituberculatus]|uniref:Osteoclast-stimulating factor 1 n=2 Tax=Portunus trituberculatus TaxID=210409 RepID=A0A5B7DEL9_PORTR|nr:Osteoclast-stimulating factor 1 [Portunus trituberculatus]
MLIVDAARRGNYELLDECLEAGVSVNALDKAGCSALHGAAHAGHFDCVMRLLKEPKLEINLQNKIGDTPLHCAAVKGHLEVVKVLLQHGANSDLINRENHTPRSLAKRGTIITLLDQGLEYEETERQGDDPADSEDSD